jgi:hypothetical protein
MTVISRAKKKWAEKIAKRAPKWKEEVEKAASENRYTKGLERFVEGKVKVGTTMPDMWKVGIGRVTAEDFVKAVSGKEDYWETKLLDAIAA